MLLFSLINLIFTEIYYFEAFFNRFYVTRLSTKTFHWLDFKTWTNSFLNSVSLLPKKYTHSWKVRPSSKLSSSKFIGPGQEPGSDVQCTYLGVKELLPQVLLRKSWDPGVWRGPSLLWGTAIYRLDTATFYVKTR